MVCFVLLKRYHTALRPERKSNANEVPAALIAQVPIIESKGKFKFERIGAPQPQDMARIAAERTAEQLRDVEPSVVPYFK